MSGRTFTNDAFQQTRQRATSAGSATHRGEERQRQGLGMDPLVDPSGYGVIRRSISWLNPEDDHFVLERGVAMLIEARIDTTGSMQKNVERAMNALPTLYNLLKVAQPAVLGRYDVQMITAIFGDICDRNVLFRSQAEMDVQIAEQMTLMVPEGGGYGNGHENPEYGLFGAAYLTAAKINEYGLKYYDFTLSDEPLVNYLDSRQLVRVYGSEVFEKVAENGHKINKNRLPSTQEVVQELLKRAHAFFLMVPGYPGKTYDAWQEVYGSDRIVQIHDTQFLPHYQAAIIGLTEGVLSLQNVESYLRGAEVSAQDAKKITRAVAGIPLGAQSELPNFNKIPLKGARMAKKGDIWPMDSVPQPKIQDEKIWL